MTAFNIEKTFDIKGFNNEVTFDIGCAKVPDEEGCHDGRVWHRIACPGGVLASLQL
jgi:hypothetical protein